MKYLDYLAVAFMAFATVLFAVYCVYMMIQFPCMLDLKIFCTVLGTSMMSLFTWVIYDMSKEIDD